MVVILYFLFARVLNEKKNSARTPCSVIARITSVAAQLENQNGGLEGLFQVLQGYRAWRQHFVNDAFTVPLAFNTVVTQCTADARWRAGIQVELVNLILRGNNM